MVCFWPARVFQTSHTECIFNFVSCLLWNISTSLLNHLMNLLKKYINIYSKIPWHSTNFIACGWGNQNHRHTHAHTHTFYISLCKLFLQLAAIHPSIYPHTQSVRCCNPTAWKSLDKNPAIAHIKSSSRRWVQTPKREPNQKQKKKTSTSFGISILVSLKMSIAKHYFPLELKWTKINE